MLLLLLLCVVCEWLCVGGCVLVVVCAVVVVVVWWCVVVVRTWCLYDVSVHATQLLATNSGGKSPGSQTPGDPATISPPGWRGSNSGLACAQVPTRT